MAQKGYIGYMAPRAVRARPATEERAFLRIMPAFLGVAGAAFKRLTAWLQGVRDALPIAVVLVGGYAALRVAPMLSAVRSAGGAMPASAPAVSPWDKSLLGKRVHLPQTDLNGRPVAIRDGTVVVSVSCTDCASPEALLSIVSASPIKPVVLPRGARRRRRGASGPMVWGLAMGAARDASPGATGGRA